MGARTSYESGTLCWADLGTSDPDAARAFYGELFGWRGNDLEGPAGVYTMLRRDGHDPQGGVSTVIDRHLDD
jgi:predicted enzyme related to lactoylglutathione lyase